MRNIPTMKKRMPMVHCQPNLAAGHTSHIEESAKTAPTRWVHVLPCSLLDGSILFIDGAVYRDFLIATASWHCCLGRDGKKKIPYHLFMVRDFRVYLTNVVLPFCFVSTWLRLLCRCFCCGSFCRCGRFCYFCCSLLAATTCLLGCLWCLCHCLVEVNELDECYVSSIALT